MTEYIEREAAVRAIYSNVTDCNPNSFDLDDKEGYGKWMLHNGINTGITAAAVAVKECPVVDVLQIPAGGIGEVSDGFHTFNGLYRQRMILFAALVKVYRSIAWKSYRHEDGELCFGGGWFIVGIDTPKGSYTYHYEERYYDLFECKDLPRAPHWDGHTEDDVIRLLSLPDGRTAIIETDREEET